MGRSIFVGDVHGCAVELSELFEQLDVAPGDDVYLVGDLVGRGPNTRRVLRLVREAGGRSVRGNHEQRLLDVRAARRRGESGPPLGPDHRELYESLTEPEWELLESLPFVLDVPAHGVRVVHAGLMPGAPEETHSVFHFTRMRTILPGGVPSDRLGGQLWGELWRGPPHVVFGHNAITGLQLHADATGLDTGCVYGGRLSALVLSSGDEVPPVDQRQDAIVSVAARRRYYVPSASSRWKRRPTS